MGSMLEMIRTDERWRKGIAVAAVSILLVAASTVGELDYRRSLAEPVVVDGVEQPTGTTTGGRSTSTGGGTPGQTSDTTGAGDPATTGDATDGATDASGTSDGSTAGATTTGSTTGSSSGTSSTGSTTGASTGGTTGSKSVPEFGLRTQGVTDKAVKFGISYNVSSCGDAGVLEAMVGAAAVGDIDSAIDAYTRYINDNGGIGGREFQVVVGDDGGGGCPEKALSAARYLVDDEKVFAVWPGVHDVADYVQSKSIPTYVGRDDPASLKRYGANGVGLTQEIGGVLEAWTAFGDYYLNSKQHKPCIVRPQSGASGDWDLYAVLFHDLLDKQGIVMVDEFVYDADDASRAQQVSTTGATRLKAKGCDQVYFMAINPIAPIFFTQAATQQQWFPQWTFTSYMALADTDLGGSLQDQQQWDNAIGLSTRVPPGEHPKEGNCKRIYERYYPADGNSDSAAAKIICAAFLTSAEMMNRGEQMTGVLTANSMLVGADSMGDYFYDAHVPLSWRFPSAAGPFTTKAWRHYTVVDWDSNKGTYLFPEYPIYWQVMGPNKSRGLDLRSRFK